MRPPATSRTCLLALVLTALAIPSCAQDTPAGTFGGSVEVRVVNVEAVVTDRSGNRVTGLGPGSFRLLVDGVPMPIAYFSEIRDGVLAAALDAERAPSPPPALSARASSDAAGTSYLVFVDEYFPLQTDRNRAISQLEDLVGRLGPRDTMAVVAFAGKGVVKLTDWTASRDTLRTVLAEAKQRPTGGYLRRFERQDTEDEVELKNYVKRLKEQTEAAVAAATSSLRVVRPPDGRKVMLLLSGGWPLDPAYLLPASEYRYAERRNLVGGHELMRPLTDTANLLGYTIYPFDLPGLVGSLQGEASEAGFDFEEATTLRLRPVAGAGGQDTGAAQRAPDPEDVSLRVDPPPVRTDQRELEDQYTLRHLAGETGGVPMVNTTLEVAFDDTRTFYWLGFSPTVKGNDARHEIRLETVDPNLEVRSRQSFVDYSVSTQTSMRVETALLSGGAEGAGSLGVTLGTSEPADRRTVLVPLQVTIATDEVTALQTADGYRIELELRAAAIDEWGRPSEIPVIPVVFTSPRPPAPGGYATYNTTVKLRRGDNDLLVTIYDPRLDRLLAKRVKIEG